ncbi:MAG: DUF4270 family protein [Bacteroidales bacterium]
MIDTKHFIKALNTYKKLSYLTLFAFIALAGCEEDPNELGSSLIEPFDSSNVVIDSSFSLSTYLYKRDSLNTANLPYVVMGKTEDPFYGVTSAGFFTQLAYSSSYGFGDNPEADSLFLYLVVNEQYQANRSADIKVYQLNTPLRLDEKYYSNVNPSDLYVPEPISLETEYIGDDTIKVALDPEYGDFLLQYDSTEVDSAAMFYEEVPGLYVTFDEVIGEKGYLSQVDLNNSYSKLTLYYNNDETEEEISDREDYAINQYMAKFNYHNYSYENLESGEANVKTYVENDSLVSDSLLFISGLTGTYAKLVVPEELRDKYGDQDSLLLGSAEIILPMATEKHKFEPSQELYFYNYSNDTGSVATNEVDFITEKNHFVADVTDYIDGYIKGEQDRNLYVNIRNFPYEPGRVTVTGENHSNPIRFKLKFYKP